MPLIKTKRDEFIIYKPEWEETLKRAKQEVSIWLSCWLAFDCIFGKRRNEISKLRRHNIWIQNNYLFVRFFVGKKKQRTGTIDKMPFTKKITLKHWAVSYILEYLVAYDKHNYPADGYIFPSPRLRKDTVTVHTKFINKQGETEIREYTYHRENGYINPDLVSYYTKKVNPNIWLHLGRHTVATRAAEDGATEYDIQNILDVSARTASKYVHRGTKLTERWSDKID